MSHLGQQQLLRAEKVSMHNKLQQLFHCTENLPQNIELQCWVFKDGDIPSVKGKVSRCVLGCNSSLASKSNHKHNYVCTLYCWYVFTKGHSRSEMYLVTAPRRYRLHFTTSLEFSRRNCMNSAYILIISYDPLLCLQVELKLQVIVLTFLNKFSSRALTPHLPIQI